MAKTPYGKLAFPIFQTIERILISAEITRQEYLQLTSALLSNSKITEEERRQINRIFDQIKVGKIKIMDGL